MSHLRNTFFLSLLLLTPFLLIGSDEIDNTPMGKNVDVITQASPKKEPIDPQDKIGKKEKEKDDIGWVLFPVVFYSSDTSVGFGASAVIFKDYYKDKFINKADSIAFVLFYTLRNQLLNANVGNVYWDNANWHWGSKLLFSKYPTDFYGIGNHTKLSNEEVFEPFSFDFENDFNYRLWRALYGGVTLIQGYYKLLDKKKDGLADKYFQSSRKEGFVSGFGLKLNYDSRDDSFFPTKGIKGELSFQYFPTWLGSQYRFSKFELDVRGYIPLVFDSVLAIQALFVAVEGAAPLSYLPALGSKDLLRGYAGGRFRDNIYIAGQMELRIPIWWRFGAVLFFGVGKVQNEMMEFFFKDLKYAGGFGIRFQLNDKKKINFRFDMGFTPEGFNFYFNLLEAF